MNDVSLKVKRGEFIAIVGPSGSGKSTFLTIAGMLLSPDSGTVSIAGKNVSAAKRRGWTKIRQEHIGFIFQNHNLLPYLKAEEQLPMFQAKENRGRVNTDEVLSELGIAKCRNPYPSEMSGGEKQRVAIARAFVNDPDIIPGPEYGCYVYEDAQRNKEKGAVICDVVTNNWLWKRDIVSRRFCAVRQYARTPFQQLQGRCGR